MEESCRFLSFGVCVYMSYNNVDDKDGNKDDNHDSEE